VTDSASKTIAPYGSWISPFTSDFLVSGGVPLGGPLVAGADIYWLEGRPTEGGRQTLIRRTPDGATSEITPMPFNIRSRVHEYGGGSLAVTEDATIYFVDFKDQNLYRVRPSEAPQQLTHDAGMRYADIAVDLGRNRLICVREDHTGGGEPVNALVAVDLTSGDVTVLSGGTDFVSSPQLSPDGTTLVWLTWDHPNMPWDGTTLHSARLDESGAVADVTEVAGGRSESIFQPSWSPAGQLFFTSDRTGFWNLYRVADGEIRAVHPADADFGLPAWTFGMGTYAFLNASTIVTAYAVAGDWRLATLDVETGTLTDIDTPFSRFSAPAPTGPGTVAVTASGPTRTPVLALIDIATGELDVLRRSFETDLDERYVSVAQPIEFPTEDGLTAHGFYYPPYNADFEAPDGELPPLVVFSHGGPTSSTDNTLKATTQFWTSRGIAVLDVNYGGSTGYGRAYWQRLAGKWGIVDIDDCCNGAVHLADQGLADRDRLAIRGGSAGGYTTLGALAFRDVFAAGASHFGVSDLSGLAEHTHKFESRYLDSLVGPYPQDAQLYRDRSPLFHLDGFNRPTIFFQGLDDKVVPPPQAEAMVEALRSAGVPVAYLPFEGEGHGFRGAAAIKRSAEAELYFYGRIFGFEPAGDIEPVEIENLASSESANAGKSR
jgi:dipeptidyl aminopeptidase/acylaminoacyl peptidase